MPERPTSRHKAYLVVTLDTRPRFPQVVRVGIYSSPATSLTFLSSHEANAEIINLESDSYQEANDKVIELVMTQPTYAWLKPWLEPGYEAHMRRYYWDKEVRVHLDRELRETALKLRLDEIREKAAQNLVANGDIVQGPPPTIGGTCDSSVGVAAPPEVPSHEKWLCVTCGGATQVAGQTCETCGGSGVCF